MHCSACGSEEAEHSKFCSKCGKMVQAESTYTDNERDSKDLIAEPNRQRTLIGVVTNKESRRNGKIVATLFVLAVVFWGWKYVLPTLSYEKGIAAIKRGDCQEGLKHLEHVAEQFEDKDQTNALFALGSMYGKGICVESDAIQAAKLNVRASDLLKRKRNQNQ